MIEFILNNQHIKTTKSGGSTVLDFVRYYKRLTGTKIGCREGDCGACTVLVGAFEDHKLVYRNMTSCLMPLTNAHGKHIVTVEGINQSELTPVQQAMVDTNGSQCGFCTIGFVMSLTGFVMNQTATNYEDAIKAIDGNICRCTGYKSIERAAKILSDKIADRPAVDPIKWLVENKYVPTYFKDIEDRLKQIKTPEKTPDKSSALPIGGGTDLNVQKHHVVKKSIPNNLFDDSDLKYIVLDNDSVKMGASVTVSAFEESTIIKNIFPDIHKHIKLISSSLIRNMATIAGNLVNASPIGDMTVFLLALNAEILFDSGRKIFLKDFYKGYKQLDKTSDELISEISFKVPSANNIFSFEKVCKRTHLDIASVNSACLLQLNKDNVIEDIHLAAGGVGPYPTYLSKTIHFLKGKEINTDNMLQAIEIMNDEISPISDVRGTKEYKSLLLRQLFLAHFPENVIDIMELIK